MKSETQLNATIDSEVCRTHKVAAKLAGSTIEQTAEAALRFFYGTRDQEVLELRDRAVAAAHILTKGKKSPFDWPLTPSTSNAVVA